MPRYLLGPAVLAGAQVRAVLEPQPVPPVGLGYARNVFAQLWPLDAAVTWAGQELPLPYGLPDESQN